MSQLNFLTGAPRSGTSLLTALIGGESGRMPLSQPVPLVLVALKRAFLEQCGGAGRMLDYPLSDQQFDDHTSPAAFREFLLERRPSRRVWEHALAEMADYSGQYTKPPEVLAGLETLLDQTPVDGLNAYFATVYAERDRHATQVWKETFSEEFLPAFLASGMACVLVMRDPRDSITSQLAGSGERYAGLPRPLLFLCRQWRKSALYALGLRANPDLAVIRYEDVLAQRSDVLNAELPAHLSLSFNQLDEDRELPRNSSFDPVDLLSQTPVGRYREWLEPARRRFVEALCHDEMVALGYTPEIDASERAAIIAGGVDEEPNPRPELARFEWNDGHCKAELGRLERIETAGGFSPELHVFEAAFEALREGRSLA